MKLLAAGIFFLLLVSPPDEECNVVSAVPQTQQVETGDPVYTMVEQMPEFPDGIDSMKNYLRMNLIWPNVDVDVSGTIVVSFIIEKDGQITNIELLRGFGDPFGFDDNAVKLIEGMPAWNPGMEKGETVRVKYVLPVKYAQNYMLP